ncbi:hypothetical protein ACSBR2_029122 [Camellia fascicularis]
MAMQTGMGLSKILILVGAGYTSTILVRWLAMEVRQLASARQITVLNGNSGQIGNMTSLIVPAAAMGASCYGCMWWKGLTFSDLMYVTKRNMATAVSNLTKHLESVFEALARHLTQRIENLDGKLDEQVEISKLIKNEVTDVRGDLSQIGFDLDALQRMVSGLDKAFGLSSRLDVRRRIRLESKVRSMLRVNWIFDDDDDDDDEGSIDALSQLDVRRRRR